MIILRARFCDVLSGGTQDTEARDDRCIGNYRKMLGIFFGGALWLLASDCAILAHPLIVLRDVVFLRFTLFGRRVGRLKNMSVRVYPYSVRFNLAHLISP